MIAPVPVHCFSITFFLNLIQSMPNRCREFLDARGGQTQNDKGFNMLLLNIIQNLPIKTFVLISSEKLSVPLISLSSVNRIIRKRAYAISKDETQKSLCSG